VRRWGIDPERIPENVEIRFRVPVLWEEYRGWIVAILAVLGIHSLLLAGLLTQRVRHRRAEARLRESEGRFTKMADEAPVMIWNVDPERRLTFANRSWVEFVGGALEEHAGFGWARLVHADDLEHALDVSGQAIERREPFSVELRMRRHDGEYRWLHCRAAPRFGESGGLLGYIGSNIDMTESREADEEQQRSTTQLAHAARVAMIGELAASVAHELNQPLAAILANAEAAEMALVDREPNLDEVRAILADIRVDDLRASQILNPIRALLRKQQQSERVRMDVNALVEDILKLARIEVVARDASLAFEPGSGLPPVVGDRTQLQQVVMNLVLNGLDSMMQSSPPQRKLVVRTSNGDPGMVRISVSDAGPGVSEALLPAIFEPFFTTKEQGLGLGLSLSRSIVKAHRGRIWAENHAGEGATFHVSLPYDQEST
jgi:PAS domain S-box-containing protein